MFHDLKAYFYYNVLSAYSELSKRKKSTKFGRSLDLRNALNLSTILFHLREHLNENLRNNTKYYINICPDYKIIGDVANASKHRRLTHGKPLLSNAENIYEQVLSTEYRDNQGAFTHIEKSVFIKLDNGVERDLFEIITNVLNMWIREFENHGIIDHIEPFKTKKIEPVDLSDTNISLNI